MKKTRIGLIHATMNSVNPVLEAFSKREEEIELVSFMDEGLIYELNEKDEVTHRMIFRLTELAAKAVESHVDGILFTCSSFSPYVSGIAELMPVPVLSSDESMLKAAIDNDNRVVIISTIKKAGPTTQKMLEVLGNENNREIDSEVHVLDEAFEALQEQDEERHNRIILDKIKEQPEGTTIVLAQYSMARAVDGLHTEQVLTAPGSGVEEIIRLAQNYQKGEPDEDN